MNKNLLGKLEQLQYFSIESFMQIAGFDEKEKSKARNQLTRAVNVGQIIRLKKGLYITGAFKKRYLQDERFLPLISHIINPISYISSMFILQKENILPEANYLITAITQKNSTKIHNSVGNFTYQYIKENLYLGFTFEEFLGFTYYQATKAKALFDYLHLKSIPREYRKKSVFLSSELRINLDSFTKTEKEEFFSYIEISGSEKMHMIFENMEKYSWQH